MLNATITIGEFKELLSSIFVGLFPYLIASIGIYIALELGKYLVIFLTPLSKMHSEQGTRIFKNLSEPEKEYWSWLDRRRSRAEILKMDR